MGIAISLLLAVHVIVCLLLVLIVMMQRPKQEGLGAAFGGGMTDQMFGADTTNVLQKATVWLTVMFFAITILLAILISNRDDFSPSISESLSESGAPLEQTTDGLPTLPKPESSLKVPSLTEPAEGGAAAEVPAADATKEDSSEAPAEAPKAEAGNDAAPEASPEPTPPAADAPDAAADAPAEGGGAAKPE